MLVSKRPPESISSNVGNNDLSSSGAPQQVSVGNYKGVMLCNRPFGGVEGSKKQKQDSKSGDGSFICGTVAKPWGCNVIIDEKSRVLSRLSKKDGALSKHKKWLVELQKEKERSQKEHDRETREKEEKKRKFMEREAKKRAIDRNENGNSSEDDNARTEAKPAWAMTEVTAKEVEKTAQEQEEEDLMSFVDDLDIEKFSHDMELHVLMNQVKQRIKELQKEKNKDEVKLRTALDSEVAAVRADRIANLENMKVLAEQHNGGIAGREDDDVRSIAESVRSTSSDMKSIHSKKSMEVLVAKSKEKMLSSDKLERIMEVPDSSKQEPIIITHQDDDGARLAETKSLSKLPFKNRNPAL